MPFRDIRNHLGWIDCSCVLCTHNYLCFVCSLWVLIVYVPVDLWWFLVHVGLSWFVLISVLHFICWCLLMFVGVCWCLLVFIGVCCWLLVFHHLCSIICSCVFFCVYSCSFLFFRVCSSSFKFVHVHSCSIIFIYVQIILNQKCYIQPFKKIVSLGPFKEPKQLLFSFFKCVYHQRHLLIPPRLSPK